MDDRFKNKAAVVTGAGRGVGRVIAMALAEAGAKVVVNNPTASKADEVVTEIRSKGGTATANYDSVATVEGGSNIIKTAIDNFGRIDILVNNAGVLRDRMIFNMAPEEWDTVMKVHLYGTFNCTKPAAVVMRQQKYGRIINTYSLAGIRPHLGQSNYGAAKEGIAGFTRACARDLGKYGITVNCYSPHAATRMTTSPEVQEAIKKRIERGEIPTEQAAEQQAPPPEENVPLVLFLASDAAANINGCVFACHRGEITLYTPLQKTIYKDGRWTLDELIRIIPTTLTSGLVNPAPPEPTMVEEQINTEGRL